MLMCSTLAIKKSVFLLSDTVELCTVYANKQTADNFKLVLP